jgi:hypothetical protein
MAAGNGIWRWAETPKLHRIWKKENIKSRIWNNKQNDKFMIFTSVFKFILVSGEYQLLKFDIEGGNQWLGGMFHKLVLGWR